MTLTLLSLSSIFQDFFDAPEDDPLLQDETAPSHEGPSPEEDAADPNDDASGQLPASSQKGDSPTPEDAPDQRDTSSTTHGDGASSSPPRMADTSIDRSGDTPVGLSSNLLRELNKSPLPDDETHEAPENDPDDARAPKRTRKFVVPYNAGTEDLEEVNDAIANGWSFQGIAVTKSRATSVKPQGKKVIITLELDKPRSLFDF